MVPKPELVVERPADLAVALIPGKGRGVLARRHFAAGEIVEICPVIILEEPISPETLLDFYVFRWANHNAVVLGYGMLYNHSFESNALYEKHLEQKLVHLIAIRDIQPGEEILINYNGDPANLTPITFADGRWWREGEL